MCAFGWNGLILLGAPQTHHHILLEEVNNLFVSVAVNFKLAICAVFDCKLLSLLKTAEYQTIKLSVDPFSDVVNC